MASGIQVTLNTKRKFELGNVTGKDALRRLANLINGALNGSGPEISDWDIAVRPETVGPNGNNYETAVFGRAVQFFTMATASGSLSLEVGFLSAFAEYDATGVNATDAQGLADAWNDAGSIQNGSVGRVTTRCALLELNNMQPGQTIKIGGYTFTAEAGTGTTPTPFSFRVGGSNADDAANLAIAINKAPGMLSSIRAQNNAAQVFLCIFDDTQTSQWFISTPNAGTVAINSQFANTGRLALVLNTPGVIGNAVGYAISGTGFTAFGNTSIGQMTGGVGCVLNTPAADDLNYKDRITSQTSKNRL